MPLPWKKAKGKSFSQLLTNHLVPPKRGASLVVETGFPTSLADLFVKNRNRFNKNNNNNNRKKKKKKEMSKLNSIPDPSDSPNPEPMQNCSRLSNSSICSPLTPPRILSVPQIPCDCAVDDWVVVCDKTLNGEVVKRKHVLMAVLKMFFVVILALGANKFAVGLALSAFLLLSMEYLGRRFGGSCLIRLVKRHEKLLVMLGGCNISGIQVPNEEIHVDKNCNLGSSKGSSGYPSSFEINDLISEIHVLQPTPNLVPLVREIPNAKCELNSRSCNEKWAMEEIHEKREEEVRYEKIEEVCMYRSELLLCDGNTGKVTRGSKIRSKLKKFANKLNDSKRKKKAKESKFDALGYENAKGTNLVDIEREFEVVCDDDFIISPSPSIGGHSQDDQINVGDTVSLENSSSCNNNSAKDDSKRVRKLSSRGCLAILVIVLAGLVGSRPIALAFALSWFLLLLSGFGTRLRCIASW